MNCPGCGAGCEDGAERCPACGAPLIALTRGTVLAERYEIRRRLGQGGMGTVYQAHDRILDEDVAIKVLRVDTGTPERFLELFIREIKLARRVTHRNVCRIHEYGEDRGLPYISMAYVDGQDLARIVRERGPLPTGEACGLVVQIAEGLQAIHDEGIVHRDLKTANVMVDGRGVARLMDFGIAKQGGQTALPGGTQAGNIVGTPDYMSPEQIRGEKVGARSDIYALGVVLFELLTGRTPFHAATPVATVMRHIKEPPPLRGEGAPPLPECLIPILERALAKSPDDRFASAGEMGEAVRAALKETPRPPPTIDLTPVDGLDAPALPAPTPAPAPRPAPSGPRARPAERPIARGLLTPLLIAGAAGGLLLLGLGIAVVWLVVTAGRQEVAAPPVALEVEVPAAPASSAPATTSPTPPPAPATPQPTTTTTLQPVPVSTTAAEPQGPRTEVRALLARAEAALEAERFDEAIGLYDEALRLAPEDAIARAGRATAINARVLARVTQPTPQAGRAFVAGKTRASEAPDVSYEDAFAADPDIAVSRDTVAVELPGRIEFEAQPERVSAGERYRLAIFFDNPGNVAIDLGEMIVTASVDGKRTHGAVPPRVVTVAPGARAMLLELSDFIRDGTRTWSLEVLVRTERGESYRNTIEWK
jgi:hypothetical protein